MTVRLAALACLWAFPAIVAAQDSARPANDSADWKSVLVSPRLGITNGPRADTATHPTREYHGGRWTVIGAVTGAVITGGAAAWVTSIACVNGADCKPAWRYVIMAAGAGAIVVGFLTGLVYGLFNG